MMKARGGHAVVALDDVDQFCEDIATESKKGELMKKKFPKICQEHTAANDNINQQVAW